MADGGFTSWNGESIYNEGLGGSETYIVEMARNIALISRQKFTVYVFCNCTSEQEGIFDNVYYRSIGYYVKFLKDYLIHAAIISRYSQYLPVTVKSGVNNIWFILHDLSHNGHVLLETGKYKILCMSAWHKDFYLKLYPQLKPYVDVFPNGVNLEDMKVARQISTINDNLDSSSNITIKKYNFIYSSFPDRGLIYLLQMLPYIKLIYPETTLDIFCDLDNKFVNNRVPDEILEIKKLLAQQSSYVTNHGWVSKKVLYQFWHRAEIWIYPCKFQETFCITALEAAASKTLAITNNLGALVNTVSDRGIIIPGDPSTKDWFSQLLSKLEHFYNPENKTYYQHLINKNYEWVQNFSWKNLAKQFYENEILTLDYANMLNWTKDIPTGSRDKFIQTLALFKDYKHLNILEIGTYVGTSIITMLSILPQAYGTVIDTWIDYEENTKLTNNLSESEIKARFYQNVYISGLQDRITILHGDSKKKLLELYQHQITKSLNNVDTDNAHESISSTSVLFDIIYVDGSHKCLDCYTDMILAWELLSSGGLMIIDDYQWAPENNNNVLDKPMEAVNHFIKNYTSELQILDVGYRVFIKKITSK